MKRKTILCILISALLIGFFNLESFGLSYKLFYFNTTRSLPLGIYLHVPSFSLQNGDIVAYQNTSAMELARENGWIPQEGKLPCLIKKIAIPGTSYVIGDDRSFIVNGHYIGQISPEDSQGHKLPQQAPGEYQVPNGMMLPYTPAPKSFDGRYLGPTALSHSEGRLIPILIW